MRYSVEMPRVAETTDELVIETWEVAVGGSVVEGQVLIRVETDKVTVEVPSPVTGTLLEQVLLEGAEAHTGSVIAIIETE